MCDRNSKNRREKCRLRALSVKFGSPGCYSNAELGLN